MLLSYLQDQLPHRRAFGATKNRVAYFNVRTQFLTENFTIPFSVYVLLIGLSHIHMRCTLLVRYCVFGSNPCANVVSRVVKCIWQRTC